MSSIPEPSMIRMLPTVSAMLAFAIALSAASSDVLAGSGYKCVVKEVYQIRDGKFFPSSNRQLSLDKEFLVSRSTGEMFGILVSSSYKTAKVMDPGSTQQSFKSIYISHPPYINMMALFVIEYEEGDAKNFVLTEGADQYTGLCRTY